nr:hypothetical protein [Desulfacinum hydrothermale]
MLSHDGLNARQTQPRSFSGGLGGEVGIEGPFQDVFRHPFTGVFHSDFHIAAGIQGGDGHRDLVVHLGGSDGKAQPSPRFAHGVARIGAQIQEHLMDLGGIGFHASVPVLQVLLDGDRGRKGRAHEFDDFLHQRDDPKPFCFSRVLAADG